MKSLKSLYYDIKIGRKWEKLNRELYQQETEDFTRAVNMARAQAHIDVKACKAYNKAIRKASRAMGL